MTQKRDVSNLDSNPTVEQSSETRSGETVRQAMSRNPATVTGEDSVEKAARLMVECDCGAIPVVDGRRVIGMITDRDIVTRLVSKGRNPSEHHVRDAMTDGAQTVLEEESLEKAFQLMSDRKIRRLAVVNANDELI